MFKWLRKKPASSINESGLSGVLKFGAPEFARAVSEMISQAEPAERAMVIVAHYNQTPMLSVIRDVMGRDGKPFDQEDFLRQLLDKDMSHPINGRRFWWFACSMLVRRLDGIAASDPRLTAFAGHTWASLIEGAQHIPALLQNNIIWKPEEKQYVLASMSPDGRSTPTPKDAMSFTLKFMLPKAYLELPPILEVQNRHGLHYFGS